MTFRPHSAPQTVLAESKGYPLAVILLQIRIQHRTGVRFLLRRRDRQEVNAPLGEHQSAVAIGIAEAALGSIRCGERAWRSIHG